MGNVKWKVLDPLELLTLVHSRDWSGQPELLLCVNRS